MRAGFHRGCCSQWDHPVISKAMTVQSQHRSPWPPSRAPTKRSQQISGCFTRGESLDTLIHQLDIGDFNATTADFLLLQVVQVHYKRQEQPTYHSLDNRRLYCLKRHQGNHRACGWKVFVRAEIIDGFQEYGVASLKKRSGSWEPAALGLREGINSSHQFCARFDARLAALGMLAHTYRQVWRCAGATA